MAFTFRLELPNGEPADPPTIGVAVPDWRPGDPVFINPALRYRVIEVREDVLVVERE